METTMETTKVPAVPGYHHKTMKLIDRLKSGKPGDSIDTAELSALISQSVDTDGDGYHYLLSARRYVARSCGLVWEPIRGAKQLRCLNGSETVASGEGDVRSIGRRARRAATKLGTIDLATLDDGTRAKAVGLAAQVGTLAQFARAEATRRIVASGAKELPTLADMLGKK